MSSNARESLKRPIEEAVLLDAPVAKRSRPKAKMDRQTLREHERKVSRRNHHNKYKRSVDAMHKGFKVWHNKREAEKELEKEKEQQESV